MPRRSLDGSPAPGGKLKGEKATILGFRKSPKRDHEEQRIERSRRLDSTIRYRPTNETELPSE